MHNPIPDQQIRLHHPRPIYKQSPILHPKTHVPPLRRRLRPNHAPHPCSSSLPLLLPAQRITRLRPGQHLTIQHLPLNNMIIEDTGQLIGSHAVDERADGVEGRVVGRKDGDVGQVVEGLFDAGAAEGADGGGQTGVDKRRRQGGGDGQDGVEYVENAVGVGEVLRVCWLTGF